MTMHDDDLAMLLAPPTRPSDSAFAVRVDLAVDEARRYAAARRRVWGRFGVEALSAASLGAALWQLSRAPVFAPYVASTDLLHIASPLALVMLLWVGTYRWRLD